MLVSDSNYQCWKNLEKEETIRWEQQGQIEGGGDTPDRSWNIRNNIKWAFQTKSRVWK